MPNECQLWMGSPTFPEPPVDVNGPRRSKVQKLSPSASSGASTVQRTSPASRQTISNPGTARARACGHKRKRGNR
eukprot:3098754-Prymnesium_polylepis.2